MVIVQSAMKIGKTLKNQGWLQTRLLEEQG